jgi:hypothetical protein
MKYFLIFLLFTAYLVPVYAQDGQKGEMYIPILNGTQNPVNITVAILDGSTPQQKLFLSELGAASQKATFIANNLNNQGFQTLSYTSPMIDWVTTSTNWPQMQTIVLCGTITLTENVNGFNVNNQYTFAGWGSAELEPNMKLQGTLAGLSFTDYCPPNPSLFGATSDTTTPHPVPNDQIAEQQAQQERQQQQEEWQQQQLEKDFNQRFVGTWQAIRTGDSVTDDWDCSVISSTGSVTFSLDNSDNLVGSGEIHLSVKEKHGFDQKYQTFIYDYRIDEISNKYSSGDCFDEAEGSFDIECHLRYGIFLEHEELAYSDNYQSANLLYLGNNYIEVEPRSGYESIRLIIN